MSNDMLLEVLLAYKAGKKIEYRSNNGNDEWHTLGAPTWNCMEYEYRIAPSIDKSDDMDKIGYYVARDKNNELHLFDRKPVRFIDAMWTEEMWNRSSAMKLQDGLFVELKWEDEPLKVEIVPVQTPKTTCRVPEFNHEFKIGDHVYFYDKFHRCLDDMRIEEITDTHYEMDTWKLNGPGHVSLPKEMAYTKEDAEFLLHHDMFDEIEEERYRRYVDSKK